MYELYDPSWGHTVGANGTKNMKQMLLTYFVNKHTHTLGEGSKDSHR